MSERASQPGLSLYDRDFFAWSQEQGRLLTAGSAAGLDWKKLAEEIEGLGRSDRREITTRMGIILQHLLKWQFQPAGRSGSWRPPSSSSAAVSRRSWRRAPASSRTPAEVIHKEYLLARQSAAGDTFFCRSRHFRRNARTACRKFLIRVSSRKRTPDFASACRVPGRVMFELSGSRTRAASFRR